MNGGTIFSSVQDRDKPPHLVLNSIKEAVVQERLKPEDKPPGLTGMTEEMRVGVSSIRETIKMLKTPEALKSKQGKDVYVCSGPSPETINLLSLQLALIPQLTKRLVQSQEMYESAFTMPATKNATEEDLARMGEIVAELEKKTKTQGADSENEIVFHSCVLQYAHNPYVTRTGEVMLEAFLLTISAYGGMADDPGIARDRRKTYESIKNHDVGSLNRVLRRNFDGWGVQLSGRDLYES